GVVETHGRKETQALLEALEIVPRRRFEYRGQSLEEMDLDAVIARHPQIVLVDELAHTNVPGSRHPKRYLDVESCSDTESTFTPPSMSSTSRASTTWSRRSRMCACARPCRTRCSIAPMPSSSSISPPTI